MSRYEEFLNRVKEDKIENIQAEINQMTDMIAENKQQIELNNDIENRQKFIQHLQNEIISNNLKIEQIRAMQYNQE